MTLFIQGFAGSGFRGLFRARILGSLFVGMLTGALALTGLLGAIATRTMAYRLYVSLFISVFVVPVKPSGPASGIACRTPGWARSS